MYDMLYDKLLMQLQNIDYLIFHVGISTVFIYPHTITHRDI